MRENHTYGKRAQILESDEPNVKYFILSEGTKTEPRYFNALQQNLSLLHISALVQIIPLERTFGEDDWSNPKKLLERLLLKLGETEENIAVVTFADTIMECLKEYDIFKRWIGLSGNIEKLLKDFIAEKYKDAVSISHRDLASAVKAAEEYIRKEKGYLGALVIDDFEQTMQSQLISYSKDIDKVCLVVDRDNKSFTAAQYDFVLKACKKNDVKLYISNPCFEFWLLLHFEGVLEMSREKLLKNAKIPSGKGNKAGKTYTETQLCSLMPTYTKDNFDALFFLKRTDEALKNEQRFCESRERLKDSVGSNLGLLIRELRSVGA